MSAGSPASKLPPGLAVRWLVPLVLAVSTAHAQDSARVTTLEGSRAQAAHAWLVSRARGGYAGAVLIERDGKVILRAGYGFANRERRQPWTTGTIAQIGSLTKQFTAAAILDLWDRGLLTPTDSLGRFFPTVVTPATAAITIDQLLTHQSGMPEYCGKDFERVSRATFLRRCLAMPPVHAPGTTFAYSNPGYSVLAAIVEHVGGMPLEAYLRSRLLVPLGLRHTGYAFLAAERDSMAVGYADGQPQGNILDSLRPLEGDYWNLKGNGGMQSTPEEMHQWFRSLLDGRILSDRARRALFAPRAVRPDGTHYGYGWFIHTDSAGATFQIGHTGSDGVFFASLTWLPRERTFVYTVSNVGESDYVVDTIRGVLRALSGR